MNMSDSVEDSGIDYLLDCSYCQAPVCQAGLNPRRINPILNQNFWQDDYLNKNHWMTTSHMNNIINLTGHKYHNGHYFLYPTVYELDIRESSIQPICPVIDKDGCEFVGTKSTFYLPDNQDFIAVCYLSQHYFAITLARATPPVEKVTIKDWRLKVFDSISTTVAKVLIDLQKLFEDLGIDRSSIEVTIENVIKQNDGSSCGFHAFFNLFSLLCTNKMDRADATGELIQYANDTDMAMRKFTVAQYRTMLAEFRKDLVNFRGKMKLKNFHEYGYLVAYDIDGNMITYENRKCDDIWVVPYILESSVEGVIVGRPDTDNPGVMKNRFTLGIPCDQNVDQHSLKSIIDIVHGNNQDITLSKMLALAKKKIGFDIDTYRQVYQFNIKVIKDMSLDFSEQDFILYLLSIKLLTNTFEEEDCDKLQKMLGIVKGMSNTFLMVSLYGELKQERQNDGPSHLCVGTLIIVMGSFGSYVSHIAVTNQRYSTSLFGGKCDGRPFTKRGIAGVLVAVGQCYARFLNKGIYNMYTWSYNEARSKGCLWRSQGFLEANIKDKSIWPMEVSNVIEKYTFYCEATLDKLARLKPMFITNTVQFEIHPEERKLHDVEYHLHKDPFFNKCALLDMSSGPSDHTFAVSYHLNHFSRENEAIRNHRLTSILYDVLYIHKRNILLHLVDDIKGNDILQDVMTRDKMIPMVALDYFGYAMMIQYENVYVFSCDAMYEWHNHGFDKACHHMKFDRNPKRLNTEFDLLDIEADNKNVMFFFPILLPERFMEKDLYILVCRRWIENDIHFLLADTSKESAVKLSSTYSTNLFEYRDIMHMFMNTPLWRFGQQASWSRVPNIQQCETECGSRLALHTYMLFQSNSPHRSLLLLNSLDEDITALGYLSRKWLSNILETKQWSVPKWVRKVMVKDKTHRYTTNWKNKFCQSITLDDTVHNLWTSNVLHDKRIKEHQKNTVVTVAGYSNICSDEAGSTDRQENVQPTAIPCKDLSDPLFLSKALEYIESLPMKITPTELYSITLPFTSEGYMVRIMEETDFEEMGYSTMIRHCQPHANGELPTVQKGNVLRHCGHCQPHANGELPTVQKGNVLRNCGDLIAEVDGHDMLGQSFDYVLNFIQRVREAKRDLKLCMIDRARIECEFIPDKTTRTVQSSSKDTSPVEHASVDRAVYAGPPTSTTSPVKHVPVQKPIDSNLAVDKDCNTIDRTVHAGTPTCTNVASVSVSADNLRQPQNLAGQVEMNTETLTKIPSVLEAELMETDMSRGNCNEATTQDIEALTKTTPVMETEPMGTNMGEFNEVFTQDSNGSGDVDFSDTCSVASASVDRAVYAGPPTGTTSPVKHVPVQKPIDSNLAVDKDCNTIDRTVHAGTPTCTNVASVSVSADNLRQPQNLAGQVEMNTVTLTKIPSVLDAELMETDMSRGNCNEATTQGIEALTKTTPVMETEPMGTNMGEFNEVFTQDSNGSGDVDFPDTSSVASTICPPPWRTPATQAESFLKTFKEKANVVVAKKTRTKKKKHTTLVSAPGVNSTRLRRLLPSRKPYNKHITEELVDTDEDENEEQVVEYVPKIPRLCTNCTFGIINDEKCSRCRRPLHKKCGMKEKEGDNILIICRSCAEGKKRFRKSSLSDATLTQEWGFQPRQSRRKPGITIGLTKAQKAALEEERNKKIAIKADKLNAWLTTIDQMLCKYENGKLCYYGRKREENDKTLLYDRFVRETLCEFYPNELADIKATRKIWHDIPSKLLNFIHSHGRCYSNETVFDAYHLCESQQWQFIKFNAEVENTQYVVDLEDDYNSTTDGYFSLTNDKTKGPEVRFVPLYYMRVWTLVCGKDLAPGQQNEVTNIERHAKKFRNKWVEIPTGAYKRKFQDLDKYDVNIPKSFRLQPLGERSCVFNSLINALHYINDYAGRDQLIKHLPTSLDYEKMSLVSHSRAAYAAQIMNKEVKGYNIQILKNFDILENRSMWPTLCVLRGSDCSINHAVTVVENYIFDSNRSCAMKLTKSNLDWCCSDFAGEQRFVAVHTAYRFNKLKPRPETLLRCPDQRMLGISSIIHAMQHKGKNKLTDDVLPALTNLQKTIEPNQCVITAVRELLKLKRFGGYRPIPLKHINDIMLQQYSPWPLMILIHATGTFCYRIVSIVGDTFFDGTDGPSLQLTMENLYYSVNSELLHQDEVTSVELIFGYRFVKDKFEDNVTINKGGENVEKYIAEYKKRRKMEHKHNMDVQPSNS